MDKRMLAWVGVSFLFSVAACGNDEQNGGGRAATGGSAGAQAPAGRDGTANAGVAAAAGISGKRGETERSGAASVGTGGKCAQETCGNECPVTTAGPSMVMLPEGYCIDSTEVTRGQYQDWLNSNPSTSGQNTYCSWNENFEPTASCMSSSDVYQGSGYENHPVVCVDWCDAYAYCQAVGKRLCGKIGGGVNLYADYARASQSQWYNACVSGGADSTYPYGGEYQASSCNGSDYQESQGTNTTVTVQSMSKCQSTVQGYAGVFDLSGNVWEWEDSCDIDEQLAWCHLRGGSFHDFDLGLPCSGGINYHRFDSYAFIGFRCCSRSP